MAWAIFSIISRDRSEWFCGAAALIWFALDHFRKLADACERERPAAIPAWSHMYVCKIA